MNYLTQKLATGIVSCANILAALTVYAAVAAVLMGAFIGAVIALTKWRQRP